LVAAPAMPPWRTTKRRTGSKARPKSRPGAKLPGNSVHVPPSSSQVSVHGVPVTGSRPPVSTQTLRMLS
jgi:hypothetical protein